MGRSYKAARRAHLRQPVTFTVDYVDDVRDPATGQVSEVEKTETFTCKGDMTALVLSELGYHADLNLGDPEGMAVLRQTFQAAFGDDAEYRRFFRFHIKVQLDDDTLMDILMDLVEDMVGRPTQPPSASSGAPSTTGGGSTAGTSPAQVNPFNTDAVPVTVVAVSST